MLQKICNFLSTVLILILAIVAAILILPRVFGVQNLVVLSGSMEPEIHVGAMVFTGKVDVEDLEVGDVITYKLTGDTLVTHRITQIDEANRQVTTKGDANNVEDAEPISYERIVGRVMFHLPYLGYLTIYGRTPLGISAVCGVVIILILLIFLPEIFKKEEPKETTKEE